MKWECLRWYINDRLPTLTAIFCRRSQREDASCVPSSQVAEHTLSATGTAFKPELQVTPHILRLQRYTQQAITPSQLPHLAGLRSLISLLHTHSPCYHCKAPVAKHFSAMVSYRCLCFLSYVCSDIYCQMHILSSARNGIHLHSLDQWASLDSYCNKTTMNENCMLSHLMNI
jgi:hypothetical protein